MGLRNTDAISIRGTTDTRAQAGPIHAGEGTRGKSVGVAVPNERQNITLMHHTG